MLQLLYNFMQFLLVIHFVEHDKLKDCYLYVTTVWKIERFSVINIKIRTYLPQVPYSGKQVRNTATLRNSLLVKCVPSAPSAMSYCFCGIRNDICHAGHYGECGIDFLRKPLPPEGDTKEWHTVHEEKWKDVTPPLHWLHPGDLAQQLQIGRKEYKSIWNR